MSLVRPSTFDVLRASIRVDAILGRASDATLDARRISGENEAVSGERGLVDVQ